MKSFDANSFYVYEFSPIDIWIGMEDFFTYYSAAAWKDKESIRNALYESLHCLAISSSFWEGDIRCNNLYIGEILDPDCVGSSHYYIGLKQDNNGTSYLIFPFEMPIYAPNRCDKSVDKALLLPFAKEIKGILDKFAPEIDLIEEIKRKMECVKFHSNIVTNELQFLNNMIAESQGEKLDHIGRVTKA